MLHISKFRKICPDSDPGLVLYYLTVCSLASSFFFKMEQKLKKTQKLHSSMLLERNPVSFTKIDSSVIVFGPEPHFLYYYNLMLKETYC